MSGADRRARPDEDRLPWLEAAPPRRASGAPMARVVLLATLVGLLIGGAFAAMHLWPAADAGEEAGLIRAPEGPYKIRPADPGGMSVEGEGSSAYVASEGGDPRGALDLSAMPETPVARGVPAPVVATTAAPASSSVELPVATDPAGSSIQLGAFSTEAKANAAWKALALRFAFLGPLTPVILPAKSGDATIYRLRAPAGVNARAMCGRLKVAGETCLVMP